MKCSMCESRKKLKEETVRKYRYRECGLDNIFLLNIKRFSCNKCGEIYHNFGDMGQLHQLIAETLIKKKELLTGLEIRFLRKYLGYSSSIFSKIIGYEVEHLSRIENKKVQVTETFDRLVRLLILERMPDRKYNFHDLLEDLIKVDWLKFSNSPKKGWELKNAA